jgi:hypothetical protein
LIQLICIDSRVKWIQNLNKKSIRYVNLIMTDEAIVEHVSQGSPIALFDSIQFCIEIRTWIDL